MSRLNAASRQATAELIARFASTGRDDPTIAARLGISVSQVRSLREEFNIAPGETRWFVKRQSAPSASAAPSTPPASTQSLAGGDSVRD